MNKEVENKIKLLKLVRNRIENGYEFYICNASKKVAANNTSLKTADQQIRSYIMKALNTYTLDDWILTHQPKSEYINKMKQARLMWIDWMINCYMEDNKE